MLIDVQTKQDFDTIGEDLLISAWRKLISLIDEFDEYTDHVESGYIEKEELENYCSSCKNILSSSFAPVQQAVEFFLKGRIIEVSPYLLIANGYKSGPHFQLSAKIGQLIRLFYSHPELSFAILARYTGL